MAVAEAKSDKSIDLFAVRSLLFLPASNPRAIAKARGAEVDLVVLDLEDAVKADDKNGARKGLRSIRWTVAIRPSPSPPRRSTPPLPSHATPARHGSLPA